MTPTHADHRTAEIRSVPTNKVAVVMDAYLPGRLAGGPVTTLSNMTAALEQQLDFVIITRDRDIDGRIYEDIEANTLLEMPHSRNIYLDRLHYTPRHILRLAEEVGASHLYLNSFFSPTVIRLLLHLRWARRTGRMRVLLAPRGEFSLGALSLKSKKKQLYLKFFHLLRLAQCVDTFQASSFFEESDIWRQLGPVHVKIAPDIPDAVGRPATFLRGEVPRLVFVSRITPKKNLHFALQVLAQRRTETHLDIYGPLEDRAYWESCEAQIRQLPAHIKVRYCGTLDHEEVGQAFGRYDAFLFPTQGENYGHVILEALGAGCPVILSDQTPWQDLGAQGAGWVCDLKQPVQFSRALDELLDESDVQAQARRERCASYAQRVANDPQVREDNLALFSDAVCAHSSQTV